MRTGACIAIVIGIATAAGMKPASAIGPDVTAQPSAPFEHWHDLCGFDNGIPSKYGGGVSRLVEAEALLIHRTQIEQRTDNPAFYRFTSTQPNVNWNSTGIPMGGDAPFLGELQMGSAGRSGYLVAPNIVMTAPHTANFNPSDYVVVFDVRSKSVPGSNPPVCAFPDPEYIPAENVYHPRALNPLIMNTFVEFLQPHLIDYAAFYLDRAVTNRRYLRIRSTGGISEGDQFIIASHPARLRTKFLYGFEYIGEQENPHNPAITFPTFKNFYLWQGMSGAGVYNLERNYVEVGVGSPTSLGCVASLAPYSMWNPNPFFYVLDLCDDTPNPSASLTEYHEFNAGPVSVVANLIPTPYLRVAPLSDVKYVLPVAGVASPAQTTYTVKASTHAATDTSVSAFVLSYPVGEPQLLSVGTYSSPLVPGAIGTIDATAYIPPGTPCGVYDRVLVIGDATHNFTDRMLHRFEIGMTDFTVSHGNLDMYAVTAPSVPTALTFTLANTRPTAANVTVALDQPWASIISSGLPPVVLALAPQGQAGSTKSVSVRLNNAAYALADGEHALTVSFSTGTCALESVKTRTIAFHKGMVRLEQSIDGFVPMPTPAGNPIVSTVDVPGAFCISDMQIEVDTGTAGTYTGSRLSDWVPHLSLSIERTGTVPSVLAWLWSNQSLPPGWSIPVGWDEELSMDVETLFFDNVANLPPAGPPLWQSFNGRQAKGTWTLRVADDGLAAQSRNEAYIYGWKLDVWGQPGTCVP